MTSARVAARLRAEAVRFVAWRHEDGQAVRVCGTVTGLLPHTTGLGDPWAEFDLAVDGGVIRALSFPGSYRLLRRPLEIGQRRRVLARVSLSGLSGPSLHVVRWS